MRPQQMRPPCMWDRHVARSTPALAGACSPAGRPWADVACGGRHAACARLLPPSAVPLRDPSWRHAVPLATADLAQPLKRRRPVAQPARLCHTRGTVHGTGERRAEDADDGHAVSEGGVYHCRRRPSLGFAIRREWNVGAAVHSALQWRETAHRCITVRWAVVAGEEGECRNPLVWDCGCWVG